MQDRAHTYISAHHIYTYNFDVDSVFQITNGDFSVNNFDYSPDGKKIIFSHQEDTNINTGFVNTDISIIESNGKNIKFLIQRPGLDSNPIFSGDGNKFAFISSGGKQESIGLRDVYIYNLKSDEINEDTIQNHLYTHNIPDPELLIRTSGEQRISNFLLWQIAYSELYFTDILWPDFRRENLYEAIVNYQKRERRFGKTSEQIEKENA